MSRDIADKFRERLQAPPKPPFEATRDFLMSYCVDAESMSEIEADIARMAKINQRTLIAGLNGIRGVLAEPMDPDARLARMIALEVGWVLDDESEAGARAWLGELETILSAYVNT